MSNNTGNNTGNPTNHVTNHEAMIRLEQVSKRYAMGGEGAKKGRGKGQEVIVHALEGLDLEIGRGEFVSIMGPSGSGKSTLLHLLGALDQPTEGQYLLEGLDISRLSDGELAKVRNKHFGFVFQAYNLFPELTALENVMVPMRYGNVPQRERKGRALERLEQVGLLHRVDHYPSQLSGGEQQRVAIARALIMNPTLILADEPTGNLSQEMGDEILALFQALHLEGSSLVIVTHDPRVGALAERILRIKDGKLERDEMVRERTQLGAVASG
jgi:putative ABC transport system ATP-binding protein